MVYLMCVGRRGGLSCVVRVAQTTVGGILSVGDGR